MSNSTPRQWRYQRDEKPGYVGHSYVWGPKVTVHCPGGSLDAVEQDMLLISAAPDLLHALETLFGADMEYCMMGDSKQDQIDAIEAARAAIAKATGK